MKPRKFEQFLVQCRVAPDFHLDVALSGPLGAVFREANSPHRASLALRPFDLSSYVGQGLISVTYDDGLLDNFTHAAPLHLKYSIPANFGVIAKCLVQSSDKPEFMSPEMCRVLHDLGFEISSHGLLHCKRLRDMTLNELHHEANFSKSVIERAIDVPGSVTTYCIPFSRAQALHVKYLHSIYSVVRHAGSMMNELPLHRKRCVSSFPVTHLTSVQDVKTLIDTAIESRSALVLMLHGISAHDARPTNTQVSAQVLEQILAYIAQQGPEQILPIRLSSLRSITRTKIRAAERRNMQSTLLRTMRETLLSRRP